MWTGVLLGILFMIYGRVQQPAAAVSASQAHFMEQMKTFQLGAMRRDVWTGRMWFRGMRLPVALLWSTLINLFIIEMRQEGRKEGTLHMVTHYLVVYFSHQVHVMSGKVETGFYSSDDLIIGPVLNFPSSASSLYSNQMDRTWTCDWINIKIDRLRALPCMQTL